MDKKIVEVDTKTFVRFWLVILAFVGLFAFLGAALEGLIIVGVAIFLAIAIQPLADRIKRLFKGLSSTMASVLAYILIVLAIGVILVVVVPMVVDETVGFVRTLPETFQSKLGGWDAINNFGQNFGIQDLKGDILAALQNFSTSFVNSFGSILMSGIGAIGTAVGNVVLTLVLTLLFAINGAEIMTNFWGMFKRAKDQNLVRAYQHLVSRMSGVISTYVAKQLTVAFLDALVVGGSVFLLSLIFGFSGSLALPLGLIALVCYLIPMFGPIISAVLVSLLLFMNAPIAAPIIFLVFYIIYAQIENNVIAPKLQGGALNIPPAIILASIVIGTYMWGLIGAIIAIPILGIIKVVIEELPMLRGQVKVPVELPEGVKKK